MNAPSPATSRSDNARSALIGAGLDLFGREGFDSVSTRTLAAAARVNIAAIAYHFGGKSGLRQACAEFVVETVQSVIGPVLARFPDATIDALAPDAAEAVIGDLVTAMAGFLVGQPRAEAVARFVVREQLDPSPAFDTLYAGIIAPSHGRVCRLFARATGQDPQSDQVRLAVFALVGQIVYFRIGRTVVLRRMNWETIGPAESTRILAVLREQTRAAIAAHRRP